MNEEKMKLGHR